MKNLMTILFIGLCTIGFPVTAMDEEPPAPSKALVKHEVTEGPLTNIPPELKAKIVSEAISSLRDLAKIPQLIAVLKLIDKDFHVLLHDQKFINNLAKILIPNFELKYEPKHETMVKVLQNGGFLRAKYEKKVRVERWKTIKKVTGMQEFQESPVYYSIMVSVLLFMIFVDIMKRYDPETLRAWGMLKE